MGELIEAFERETFGADGSQVEAILSRMTDKERDAFGAIISRPDPHLKEMAEFLNACRVPNGASTMYVSISQVGAWWDRYSQGGVARELRERLREYENIPYMSMLEKLLVDTVADLSWVSAKCFNDKARLEPRELVKLVPQLRKTSMDGIKILHDMKTQILKDELEIGGALLLAEKLRATFANSPLFDAVDLAITKCLLDMEVSREP
jgi:hypothetical protein